MRVSMYPESGTPFPWTDIGMLSVVNFMEFGHSETHAKKIVSQVVITDNNRTVVNPLVTDAPSPGPPPQGGGGGGRGGRGAFLSTSGTFTLSSGGGSGGGGSGLEDDD